MRVIDRLHIYLQHRSITTYAFSESCGVSKSYMTQQRKGKGNIGSDTLEKIKQTYPELNLLWLITGKGPMLIDFTYHAAEVDQEIREDLEYYLHSKDEIIRLLRSQLHHLETALQDKQKLIGLLEHKLASAATQTQSLPDLQ